MKESASALRVQLPESTVTSPRSVAVNYEPPLAVTAERMAVDELLALARAQCADKDYVELQLDDFDIYRDPDKTQARLVSLHHLGTDERLSPRLYFDGILRVDGSRPFYVQRVPVLEAPVDNYGADCDTAAQSVWLRSELGRSRNVFYRLGRPSAVYARFFRPYLWVVDLGKHVVDFCEDLSSDGRDVRLSHFKTAFARWLRRVHAASPAVRQWHAQFGRDDFRTAVTAHREYLWREVSSILGEQRGRSLGFFREVSCQFYRNRTPGLDRQPLQPTVVTPYNYRLFSHLAIGPYLQETTGPGLAGRDEASILPQHRPPVRTGPDSADRQTALRDIQAGDVISCLRDSVASGSGWSDEGERSPFWYALVHRVTGDGTATGRRRFDVAWLYAPEHTTCRQMRYPWRNELFLSDHCTCDEDGFIAERDVVGVHSVDWFGRPDSTADFFVRQTYLNVEKRFVRLCGEHTVCKTSRSRLGRRSMFGDIGVDGSADVGRPYAVGDTVLATLAKTDVRSEPYEIVGLVDGKTARLRRLLRRRVVDATAPAAAENELVYGRQVVVVRTSSIVGRCVVRVFQAGSKIPSPYNRGGAGNVFFMTHRECLVSSAKPQTRSPTPQDTCGVSSTTYIPLDDKPPSLRQGFDPTPTCQRKLRALDLFCGCGSLGRGLEDSGIVETRWANDIWDRAIHTLMANRATADAVEPFLGSADALLARALQGRYSRAVPAPGEVDVISGGSPCQGFSALTSDKAAPKQYKNRSMVASFASMVDLYRPTYGVLENVPAFVGRQPSDKNDHREDIFGQLQCALVGLGYQVAVHLGNAWAYGAPQGRQRVFLLFAAPAVQLPAFPLASHSTPAGVHSTTAVGGLANGDCIAEAWDGPTAFPYVSIGRATADLQAGPADDVDDGLVDICIPHPDHRVCADTSDQMRRQIAYVPAFPYGMNVPQTVARRGEDPATTPSLRTLFNDHVLAAKRTTNAYKRVDPTRLLATVTTSCNVADGWTGAVIHWRHRRPLTVLEARRAQGMPDDDVLVGSPKDQWKMVGNAVARPLAMAIGLAVRESWLGSLDEDPTPASCRPSSPHHTDMPALTATSPASSPFKQNRIFKTSVRKSVSGATVVSLGDWAEQDQPRKRLPPVVVIDLTAKRPRYDSDSEATMVGDDACSV